MSTGNRNHVLAGARGSLLGLRIAQLVVGIVVLGLSAYGVYWLSFDGNDLTLFSSTFTIAIVIYVLLATLAVPGMYNYWAILGLDILGVIFWVISFSLLASEIASYTDYYNDYASDIDTCYVEWDGVCYYKHKRSLGVVKRATTTLSTYQDAMIAAAALGGLEFVLFAVTLVIVGVQLHRHRKAGGNCTPGSKAAQPQFNGGTDVEQTSP